MAVSSDVETIELSEAIRTILAESNSPGKGNTPGRKPSKPTICHERTPEGSFDLDKSSENRQKYLTPKRGGKDCGDVQLTPLSRKSSILQRSLGSDYGRSTSPKKRRHSRNVIILRPPKKRAVGSTPRVTSTSKLTPCSSSSSSSSKSSTSAEGISQEVLQTTPVSSLPKSRLSKVPVSAQEDIQPDMSQINLQVQGETDQFQASGNGDQSLTPDQLLFLNGGDNGMSAREKEDLLMQAQYLSLLEQQQQSVVMGGGSSGVEGQQQDLKEFKIGQGGINIDVADQTGKISLVARGNQDDSLTNITWLRRMSAPDLDPGTLKQIKDPHKERPPYSYSALIQFAISSAPEGKLTLRDIYFWIETNFPYFRTAKLGWKNSIRHNLSLHKIFVREAPSGPGQPAYWTLRPGTIVRMPERKVVVHDERAAAYQANCRIPDGTVNIGDMNPGRSLLLRDRSGLPSLLPAPENPGRNTAPVLTSTPVGPRPNSKASKRIPPILPKGTPPYALVPLPIYFTTDPMTGQLVPACGENVAPGEGIPSLAGGDTRDNLSQIDKISSLDLPGTSSMDNGASSSSSGSRTERSSSNTEHTPTRRPKVIVEKSNSALMMHNIGRTTMDSGYGSTDSSVGDENMLSGPRDFKLSNFKSDGAADKENVLSDEFDLGLDVDDDLLKTPPKSLCPDWLSPIRGFGTPGPDSGFSIKDMDFNFTPFKTGFTPNRKVGESNTPRQQMLSPLSRNAQFVQAGGRSGRKARMMTPRRFNPQQLDKDVLVDGFHNASFEQMFGGVELDVDPDSIDVGSMSWLLQSPPHAK